MGKSSTGYQCRAERHRMRFVSMMLALLFVLGMWGAAGAFEIPTGNEDIKINWDNSLRLNFGYRMKNMSDGIVANPNLDDGDRNFEHGLVQTRLDILSEFDVVYKRNYGFRVSGAGWYDAMYHHGPNNQSFFTANHFDKAGNQSADFSDYVKKHYGGPYGELLDAFVFGNFVIADIPISVKLGRHVVYWGESLGVTAANNGVAYAQQPLDYQKAYAVPNVSAKEVFRPLNSFSFTVMPFQSLAVSGQYFLQWEASKYPEAGTFLAPYDMMMDSAEVMFDPVLIAILRGDDITPKSSCNFREYGISARWSPTFLDGTLGFYFRRTADKLPQFNILLDPVMSGLPAQYRFNYPDSIKIYGVSLSKQILGVAVGAEFSYRENMPLISDPAIIASDLTAFVFGLPPGSYRTSIPDSGDTYTARGNTWHGLINFLGLINKTWVFDSAVWQVEFNWQRWERVTENESLFKGRAGYNGVDRVSKDCYTVDLSFTPTWYQVIPGVDLSMPIAFGQGLTGNSATSGVANQGAGYWFIGLSADIVSRYKVDLGYVDYFGVTSEDVTGTVTNYNGDYALLKDRSALSLTLRYTF
jgi:Protein of unknown function (DUF1302)